MVQQRLLQDATLEFWDWIIWYIQKDNLKLDHACAKFCERKLWTFEKLKKIWWSELHFFDTKFWNFNHLYMQTVTSTHIQERRARFVFSLRRLHEIFLESIFRLHTVLQLTRITIDTMLVKENIPILCTYSKRNEFGLFNWLRSFPSGPTHNVITSWWLFDTQRRKLQKE